MFYFSYSKTTTCVLKNTKRHILGVVIRNRKIKWVSCVSVCLNISNGHMIVTMTDARVEDGRISVNCIYNHSPCIFLCEYQKNMCFNGSSFCFDATVTNKTDPPRVQFDLTPCKCSLKQTAHSERSTYCVWCFLILH